MSGGNNNNIPTKVKKIIQNIKEITGNHTDDEIYAMLQECSMDPNETTQKLLHQDTFHEVKRRRDKKKETNRETVDPKWRSGPSGRVGRGGRANHSSRFSAQDAVGGRNNSSGKENGISQGFEKAGSISSSPTDLETRNKSSGSSVTVMANGPVGVISSGSDTKSDRASEGFPRSGNKHSEPPSRRQPHAGGSKKSNVASGVRDAHAAKPATTSGFTSSASDQELFPSVDSRVPVVTGSTMLEGGNKCFPVEPNLISFAEHKSNAGKLGKSHAAGRNQAVDFSQSTTHERTTSSSRPSSNYGSRSQQGLGSQKGPNKEWKPKPTNTILVQGSKTSSGSEGNIISADRGVQELPAQNVDVEDKTTHKLQKDLERLQVGDVQHVIIPDHIHVPEAVRTGLSFGSFDAPIFVNPSHTSDPESQNNSGPVSEINQDTQGTLDKQSPSQSTAEVAEEAGYTDKSESPKDTSEEVPSDIVVPSSSEPEFSDSTKETTNGVQLSGIHTSAGYSFGLMPQTLGNSLGSLEGSDAQARDVARVSSVMVQPPMDPSSFYTQFYRSGADSDGRISPFPAPEVATKYGGSVGILSSQTSPLPAEGGNSLVLSTAAPTPLSTQASGILPSSLALNQQPVPIFRQPPGVHLPHYPPNYIPYGHYLSPFYVPPPAMHQFFGHNAFAQQAQAGSVYPGPAAGVKFPMSQYKPGSNIGNATHMGVGGSYGPYGTIPGGYGPGSATAVGNSTTSEDLAATQFKDSNVYIAGQQSEGSGVWIPAPARDMSSLPPNSFYNLPPPGQHVTFAPTQVGQGAFAGIYHPGQTVAAATVHPLLQQSQAMPGAVDMVGATGNVYQQPQHSQLNWPNNY